jgi:hypothetical protein
MWSVGEDCALPTLLTAHPFTLYLGSLTRLPTEPSKSPYTPRFVRFIEKGQRVMVGYLDTREMSVLRCLVAFPLLIIVLIFLSQLATSIPSTPGYYSPRALPWPGCES